MAKVIDFIKKLFGFPASKPKDDFSVRLSQIQSFKEKMAVLIQKLTDRRDILNEQFKMVMSARDTMALEEVQRQYKFLSDEASDARQSITFNIQDLDLLKSNSANPLLMEISDELEEMQKAVNNIIKHEKAAQHARVPDESPAEEEQSVSDASGVEVNVQDEETKPGIKPKVRTALEDMQNQQTILLTITDDMLKPPSEMMGNNEDPQGNSHERDSLDA